MVFIYVNVNFSYVNASGIRTCVTTQRTHNPFYHELSALSLEFIRDSFIHSLAFDWQAYTLCIHIIFFFFGREWQFAKNCQLLLWRLIPNEWLAIQHRFIIFEWKLSGLSVIWMCKPCIIGETNRTHSIQQWLNCQLLLIGPFVFGLFLCGTFLIMLWEWCLLPFSSHAKIVYAMIHNHSAQTKTIRCAKRPRCN